MVVHSADAAVPARATLLLAQYFAIHMCSALQFMPQFILRRRRARVRRAQPFCGRSAPGRRRQDFQTCPSQHPPPSTCQMAPSGPRRCSRSAE